MEKITALQAEVLPVTEIIVKNGGAEAKYTLVLDYCAIVKAQQHPELSKIKAEDGSERTRDLSNGEHWAGLTGPDLTIVAWAALDKHHPEVELREVRRWLSPAKFYQLYAMLLEQCYPGALDRIEAAAAAKERSAANPPAPVAAGLPMGALEDPPAGA